MDFSELVKIIDEANKNEEEDIKRRKPGELYVGS